MHSAFLNIADGRAWCSRHARCRGFTTKAPQPTAEGSGAASVLFLTFHHDGGDVVHSPEWYTWTKLGAARASSHTVSDAKEEL